jgi:hypothetical protein
MNGEKKEEDTERNKNKKVALNFAGVFFGSEK